MKRLIFLGLLLLPLLGCNGSGAVNPLAPANASKVDASDTQDSDVIYWSNFPLTNPITDSVNAICLINKKNGWACGNNGLVMQYDGQTWNQVQVGLGQNENFMAVGFLNESEGWIVGTHGIILHYNNGQWTQDNSPTTEVLYGIAITQSRTVWVVGSNATILSYNGISWASVTPVGGPAGPATITGDIYSVGLSDQNSGWAVGNLGLILKFDGQKWQNFVSPTTERLNSVSILSDVQAWAVGAYGTILNFNGTTWNKMGSAFSGFDLYTIAMKDDSDGWLGGQDGTIAFYDGTRWIAHKKPDSKPSLNAVAFYKDLGFMVGQNGTFLKFQTGGVPDKFDLMFKGVIKEKPSKAHPYWSITYTLLNESPKTTAFLDFVVPVPKGYQLYQPFSTPVASQTSSDSTPVAVAASAVVSTPTAAISVSTFGTQSSSNSASTAPNNWKMKDENLVSEIGTVNADEQKIITLLLTSKKNEKKEYPVVVNASLKTVDRTIQDAVPVTLLVSEPKPVFTPTLTPPVSTPTVNVSPNSNNSEGTTGVQSTSISGN